MLVTCTVCKSRSNCNDVCNLADTEQWMSGKEEVTVERGRHSYTVKTSDITLYAHNDVVLIKFPFPTGDGMFNTRFYEVFIK